MDSSSSAPRRDTVRKRGAEGGEEGMESEGRGEAVGNGVERVVKG